LAKSELEKAQNEANSPPPGSLIYGDVDLAAAVHTIYICDIKRIWV
jgi:hypothetical protein